MLGAPTTILMQAQANAAPAYMNDGTLYTPDTYGFVAAQQKHVNALIQAGFQLVWQGLNNFRNILDGGDFSVNPWQRNVAGLATAGVLTADIANTVTYFPDRFFAVGGASSAIKLSKIADATVQGFSVACKFQRKAANANVADINFGQVCETADSIRMQGQKATISLWAKAGANWSGLALRVRLFSGTGTDDTAANMVAGSWAGSTTPIDDSTTVPGSSWQRYQFTGTVPTGGTQLGILLGYTPVGTAGADDSISFMGIQLEAAPAASPFEHRDVQVELEICQRYAWLTTEPAAGVVVGAGMNTTTAIQVFYMATPVQFRAAPTVTVSAGTFKTNQANTATATTITPGTTHTTNAISVNGNSAGTAGQGTLLQGGGGSGWILASSDY